MKLFCYTLPKEDKMHINPVILPLSSADIGIFDRNSEIFDLLWNTDEITF